jgi:hypothetical protein
MKKQKRKEVDHKGRQEMMRGRRDWEIKGQGWKEEGEEKKVAMRGERRWRVKGRMAKKRDWGRKVGMRGRREDEG